MATLLLALSACDGSSVTPPDAPPAPPDVADLTCPTHREKISFDRAHGCQNDGFVVVHIPTADVQGLADIRAVRTTSDCNTYNDGSTACWIMLSWDADCLEVHGAMTEPAWQQMCQIAAIDGVANIAPFWAE
jgi:hypothetical protein